MKISKYNICIKSHEEYILFSTLSKYVISIDIKKYNDLIENVSNGKYKLLKKDEIKFLYEKYFIIDDEIEERQISNYLMNKDRLDQKIFTSYIAFSTLCNFACVYCYEEGQSKRDFVMTNEILKDTVEWYYSKIKECNYKECHITLYGGEPLIYINFISQFLEMLNKKYLI